MAQSRPTTIPQRDPTTGKFVSSQSFDEVETVTFNADFSVPAAQMTGATDQFYADNNQFDGVQVYDLDELVDRHEVGTLLQASHRLVLQPTGTQTADSSALATVEVSGSPRSVVADDSVPNNFADIDDQGAGEIQVQVREPKNDDSLDLVGRPLAAMAQGPFTDGTNGLGGGGGPGHDSVEVAPYDYSMDRRDEMYINGRVEGQNIADGPITFSVVGQHVYSVVQD